MEMTQFQSNLFHKVKPHFASMISEGIKDLLETKHLYQNYRIKKPNRKIVESEMEELIPSITDYSLDIDETIDFVHSSFPIIEWKIINPSDRKMGGFVTDTTVTIQTLRFTPPSLKLYCSRCKRTEPYNFLFGQDLLENFRKISNKVDEQIFSLAYQCQSCKGTPEIFIIYRKNLKLVQSGRSPMEKFDIPNFIPKSHRKFYSDAIIAYNSGQILAGNFLLRTFIEQYVRSQVSKSNTQDIEAIFDEYKKDLPDDFNRNFPSLYSIYGILSSDIHSATGSEEIFTKSKKDTDTHFKAKQVFSDRDST